MRTIIEGVGLPNWGLSGWRGCALAAAAAALLCAPGPAGAAMESTKLGPLLCETTGGGKFVDIRGFPGEKIDRRLRRDIRYLRRRYPIFITDGYSLDPAHSANGEHPIGLALDIVPHVAEGGGWGSITQLANWAEPIQDQPRAPFRWVGYNGDAHHGKGHHLHLSWSHSPSSYNKPARTVYTLKCPGRRGDSDGGGDNGGDGDSDGGISTRRSAAGADPIASLLPAAELAPVQPETGGVGLP